MRHIDIYIQGFKVKISKHLLLLSRKHDKSALQLLVGVSFVLLLPQANAAEVTKKIIVEAGVGYDSNPDLTVAQKEPVWIYTLVPQFVLGVNDEVNRWYLDVAVAVQRHSNERVLINREDPKLTAGWDRTYESGMYGIKADYSERSSRVDELRTIGVFSRTDNTEKTRGLGANWMHTFNPRWSVSTDAAYHDITYSSPVSTLGNYNIGEIASKLTYANSEKLNTHVQLGYAKLNPDKGFQSTDMVRLMLGADYKVNESFNLGAHAGVYDLSGRQSDSDWEAGVNAEYTTERMDYRAELGRAISASGFGGFQKTDYLTLGWVFTISEFDKVAADYSLNKYKKDTSVDLSKLDYQQVGASYERILSSHWKTRFSVAHRQLTDSSDSDAQSNVIGATLIFDTLNF